MPAVLARIYVTTGKGHKNVVRAQVAKVRGFI